MTLDHVLERTVLIRARRETVFRYFTDSERFAAWWGAGSTIDARPGGALRIRYPNGALASGEVVEVVPHQRVVFTYGYEDAAKPVRPGGSRVVITLEERKDGTLLHLRHELPDAASRDQHVQGWRYRARRVRERRRPRAACRPRSRGRRPLRRLVGERRRTAACGSGGRRG